MATKLTVIVDNVGNDYLKGEWGLSILVEHSDKKILADVGGSELFAKNLIELGFDIRNIDFATLSHAHYDHANGMERFFQDNESAKFYLRDTTGEDCYLKYWVFHKYIGIPKGIVSEYSDRIQFVSGDYELCDGAYLVPHKTDGLEKIGKREKMYRKTTKGWKPDNFSHEQSLVLDTDKGLVIINCCSHGGVINIINEVKATFPEKKVYGLIGGFHLFNKQDDEIIELAKEIKNTGIEYVCTGHCTKQRAYDILKGELSERLDQLKVGHVMEF